MASATPCACASSILEGKHGRLGAPEVVAARAVGHVAIRVDEVGEVLEHIAHQLLAAIGGSAEHGEARSPVVQLPEAATWNPIGVGQLQQR